MKNLIQAYKLFENRINEVDSYIDNMMSQSDVLSGLLNLEVSEKQKEYLQYLQSSTGKTIQYNAVIISLYGSFENFIDSMLQRKRKTRKNKQTTVLPGMLSVMRSFSLWEEGYNEETT